MVSALDYGLRFLELLGDLGIEQFFAHGPTGTDRMPWTLARIIWIKASEPPTVAFLTLDQGPLARWPRILGLGVRAEALGSCYMDRGQRNPKPYSGAFHSVSETI